MTEFEMQYLQSKEKCISNDSMKEFVDWQSEMRLAIHSKFFDPTTIRDITPEYFAQEVPATVGNPTAKPRMIKIK